MRIKAQAGRQLGERLRMPVLCEFDHQAHYRTGHQPISSLIVLHSHILVTEKGDQFFSAEIGQYFAMPIEGWRFRLTG